MPPTLWRLPRRLLHHDLLARPPLLFSDFFAAAGGIIPELTMFTVAEASDFNREWLLEKIKTSQFAADDQVNQLPYGLTAPSFVKEALAEGAVAVAFGRFMADFIGSAEYHGP